MRQPIRRVTSLLSYVSDDLRSLASRPGPTSFFPRAFLANRDTAHAVAATPYLRSMHDGTLDPRSFGGFMVQDAYYCYHAQATLREVVGRVDRATCPDLHELLAAKVDVYDDYNRAFLEDWHIRDAESVVPTETVRLYVEHERRVAREEEPIYTLVVYLPCYHLWPWFVRQLMMSPRYQPGVYRGWFEGVYPSEREGFGEAWLLGNFIEGWKAVSRPFDEALAHDIYRTSMGFELRLFSEACD